MAAIFGFLSGIVSGMGIGGGAVLIPLLTLFLKVGQRAAQGINLLYFLPTAAAALIVHIKNKQTDFRTALFLTLCALPFAYIGSRLALMIGQGMLRKLFAVFLFLLGGYELLGKKGRS